CDIDAFRVTFDHEPRCPWNISAGRVFAEAFIKKYKLPASEASEIEQRFYQRLRSLKRTYGERKQGPEMKLRKERSARKEGRRSHVFVFHRRVFVFEQHPSLKPFLPEVERLGADGMSSDDSEYEGSAHFTPIRRSTARPGQRIDLVVRKPLWRSESLSRLLHTADLLYPILRRLVTWDHRGGLPHPRLHLEDAESTSRKFPHKLPTNAYSRSWQSQQKDLMFVVAPLLHEYNYDNTTHTMRE
ncbi:hypothetical protein BJ165DRAFT_1355484, partial [Panaeolus papilionaceus]